MALPLAEAQLRLTAAETLARAAACGFDAGSSRAGAQASVARLSARRAALGAAFTAHQVFGAIGITTDGPAFHVSRRIQQLATQPPGDGRAYESALAELGLQ